MIFRMSSQFRKLSEKQVQNFGGERAWEQWFDVQALNNGRWSEAVLDQCVRGKECKRLRNLEEDSGIMQLASQALSFKLTGGEKIQEMVTEKLEKEYQRLVESMDTDVTMLMTTGLQHSIHHMEQTERDGATTFDVNDWHELNNHSLNLQSLDADYYAQVEQPAKEFYLLPVQQLQQLQMMQQTPQLTFLAASYNFGGF